MSDEKPDNQPHDWRPTDQPEKTWRCSKCGATAHPLNNNRDDCPGVAKQIEDPQ